MEASLADFWAWAQRAVTAFWSWAGDTRESMRSDEEEDEEAVAGDMVGVGERVGG